MQTTDKAVQMSISIVKEVHLATPTVKELMVADLDGRSVIGIKKYNTTLSVSGLSELQLLQHLYEELLDAMNYSCALYLKTKRPIYLKKATKYGAEAAEIKTLMV